MLRNILFKIKELFNIEGASIALHDVERRELFFIRTAEELINGEKIETNKMRFPDDYGVAGRVLRENRSITINDVTMDERFSNKLDLQQNFSTRSMICVPLRSRKKVIGVLYALNKISGNFLPKESLLLEITSSTIAIAIENARLYGDVKRYAATLEQENLRLLSEVQNRFNLQGIVGSSQPMRRVFELLNKVIGSTTAVFLQGATGTGKELVAKAIHYNGPLKNKPFVAENCSALSEHLLESELFGHVKGAFTGAVADKKGLFEMADGGTVFLDEVADMPPAMQTKLLRVLQEGIVRPVGAEHYRKVNFRLITSSNRDLLEAVRKGDFRDDLYYRIHVFPIVLPQLKDRSDDIPLLAAHFLEKFAAKFQKSQSCLAPQALECLMRYDWPGNIRELENEIERAITLAGEENEIKPEHFSQAVSGIRAIDFSDAAADEDQWNLKAKTEHMERRMIIDALRNAKGNRSQAARLLGLTRQGLLNKIARYRITVDPQAEA
jgi:Nif-specific regulatory protein